MSISTELTRLQTGRNKIRAKLTVLGLAQSTDKLDALATAIEGITDNGAVSANVQEGETYTIPKGYHNGSGTVSGVAGGGNYTLQSKTVKPTKSQINVTPDSGYYGLLYSAEEGTVLEPHQAGANTYIIARPLAPSADNSLMTSYMDSFYTSFMPQLVMNDLQNAVLGSDLFENRFFEVYFANSGN